MRLDDPYREAKPDAVGPGPEVTATEVIVHGVGGAPPSDVLVDFHPDRVSGDHLAGFYRPQAPPDRKDPELPPGSFPREAFAWGGLTSGNASRALWFLLLPFALMNTAGWMHPELGGRRRRALVKGALRLLAALGTVMVVLMLAQLSLDLVGYQCGWRVEECRDTHWWLSYLDGTFFASYPSRVLVVSALVPLTGLTLLWAAGLLSFRSFEEYLVTDTTDPTKAGAGSAGTTMAGAGGAGASPTVASPTVASRAGTGDLRGGEGPVTTPEPPAGTKDAGLSDDPDTTLEDPSFWKGAHPVRRLRRLHFQAGVVTIGIVLALSVAELEATAWSPWAHLTVWGGTAALAALVVAIVHPKVAVSAPVPALDNELVRVGGWIVAAAVLAGAALYGLFGVGVVDRVGATPRLDGMIPLGTILTTSQFALGFVLLFVFAVARNPNRGSFLRVGPVIAMALGWFMIMSVWAGTGLRIADWFGQGQADVSRFWHFVTSTCGPGTFCYPIWYEDAAVGFTAVLIVAVLGIILAVVRRPAKADVDAVKLDFPGSAAAGARRRLKTVARRHRHPRIVSKADAWVAAVVLVGVVGFLIVGFTQVEDGWRFPRPVVTFSSWMVALVPIALVIVVRLGLNNASARRGIGAVFDVLTFFPRRVHPFAPPCYGERAVPQLRWRIGWLDDDDRGVVLRAHSQGTVIAAATLLQGVERPGRVRLVTYGSPLVMLYQHHFPAYFGDIVDRVGAALGEPRDDPTRWVHLCANTDPLGCRLTAEGRPWLTQVRVRDPETWGPRFAGDAPPPSLGHSTYHRHPELEDWVRYLLRRSADLEAIAPVPDVTLEGACG